MYKIFTMPTEALIDLHMDARFPGGLNPVTAREATVSEEIVYKATGDELVRRGTEGDETAAQYLLDEYGPNMTF